MQRPSDKLNWRRWNGTGATYPASSSTIWLASAWCMCLIAAPHFPDLLSGQVATPISGVTTLRAIAYIKRQLRALAVTTAARSAQRPDSHNRPMREFVPTLSQVWFYGPRAPKVILPAEIEISSTNISTTSSLFIRSRPPEIDRGNVLRLSCRFGQTPLPTKPENWAKGPMRGHQSGNDLAAQYSIKFPILRDFSIWVTAEILKARILGSAILPNKQNVFCCRAAST